MLRAGVVKVPEVTLYFWVVKLLTTAMGEAISDYLVNDWNKFAGVLLGFIAFAVAIFFQFRSKTYSTWLYWLTVSMVAVFGTMCADVLHVVLGLPYIVSFVLYAVLLAVTFTAWYRSEGTLDIHSVNSRRREVFYWLTVIFTFAMGTAVGDLTAMTFHLGYLASAFMFLGALSLPLIAWRLGASPVATFWVAYVLTRPAGASFADYFGMPKDISGMGLGHGAVSVVTLILVVASFVYLSRSGIDQPEAGSLAGPPHYAPSQYPPSQYGQPQYGQPQYADPRQGQPPYGQQPSGQPQYADPRRQQGDPRYAADPRYGNQPYGDQRDYR